MQIRKSRILLFVCSVVVLRLLLDTIYHKVISPVYAYAGLDFLPSADSITSSWGILALGTACVLPFLRRKDFVVPNAAILLFVLFFVPWTSFIGCKSQPMDYLVCETVFWMMTFAMLHVKIGQRGRMNVRGSEAVLLAITVILVLTIIYISGVYAHFRMKFDLVDVYDLRMEAREFHLPTLLAYIWAASSNVLTIIIIYFISRRRWWLASLVGLVIVMNFSINGSKSTLFKLLLCFIMYYSTATDFKHKVAIFLACFVGLGLAEYWVVNTPFIADIIVRRTFYVTSLLDSYYYDLISQYGPAYFTHQVNGQDVQFHIGELFFDRDYMRANNGLFSDAFMNLGWIGCFIYPVIYAILLNICERVFSGQKTQIKTYTVFLIVLTMRSSELTTALLTHGLFILCMTIAFMPRPKPIAADGWNATTNKHKTEE